MHDHQEHGHRFSDISRLRSPERLARLEVDRVVDLALDRTEVQTVLDIGTGTGVFAEAFSQRGKSVTGVDVNPEMLAVASHYVSGGVFQPSAAESLPFPDASFDLAFMGLVLHETDDLLKALQEAYRVTRLRLAVLEWPYVDQEFGPGLEERLETSQVMKLAREAGFTTGETVRLEQLVLYLFDKNKTPGRQLNAKYDERVAVELVANRGGVHAGQRPRRPSRVGGASQVCQSAGFNTGRTLWPASTPSCT